LTKNRIPVSKRVSAKWIKHPGYWFIRLCFPMIKEDADKKTSSYPNNGFVIRLYYTTIRFSIRSDNFRGFACGYLCQSGKA
jgi:hypothetical protein